MAENSAIEWTDNTANFWWGCVKVSPGCEHCYADTLAKRYGKAIWGPAKTTRREAKKAVWANVLKWDKEARELGIRKRMFVMSMGDFLEDHPDVESLRGEAVDLLYSLTNTDVQLLTKRPDNARRFLPGSWFDNWPAHIWMGTSVENQAQADKRIPELAEIPAAVRFLSMEPLLGPVDLTRLGVFPFSGSVLQLPTMIHWVIIGGESGHNARPFDLSWAYSIINQCKDASVPVFMKQFGNNPKSVQWGYTITGKGGNWNEWPADLRVREFPELALV